MGGRKLFHSPKPRDVNQRTLTFSSQKRPRPSAKRIEREPVAGPSPKKKLKPNVTQNERMSHSDSNSDTEDETEDSTSSKDSIQLMSIHRILIPRRPNNLDNVLNIRRNEFEKEERLIEKIIDDYNNQQEKKTSSEDSFNFKKMPNKDIELASTVAKSMMAGRREFKNQLYVQKTNGTNTLLRWCGMGQKIQSCNIHMIWFLYRPEEIFAITTNQAWNVVHKYSDFEFPGKVAARMCSEEGARYTDDKVLIGNLLQSTKLMKGGLSPSTNDVPVLCTSFTADLRDSASILKIPCFEKERGKKTRASIIFGFGYLRFKKRFMVSDFPLILNHLSTIARGEETEKYLTVSNNNGNGNGININTNSENSSTARRELILANDNNDLIGGDSDLSSHNDVEVEDDFITRDSGFEMTRSLSEGGNDNSSHDSDFSDTNDLPSTSTAASRNYNNQWSQDSFFDSSQGPISEKDTDVYQRNFTKLPKDIVAALDEELAGILNEVIKVKRPGGIDNFELSYRYTKDFAMATSLSLIYKTTVVPLSINSTLKEIVNSIIRSDDDELLKLRNFNETDRKKIKEEMKQIKIQYKLPDGKDETDSLVNFMEGELIYREHVYWRVIRQWCKVNKDYLMTAHRWFTKFLRTNLTQGPNGKLPRKWPSKAKTEQLLAQDPIPNTNLTKYYTSLLVEVETQDGFYGPPADTPDNSSSLFDLLHLDRGTDEITIYFFSSSFTYHTSKLCERIFRCREEIKKALREPSIGPFKKFFKQELGRQTEGFVKENYKNYINSLSKCTIMYVLPNVEMTEVDQNRYGPMDTHLQTSSPSANQINGRRKCSLWDESKVSFKVTLKEIQKCLKNAYTSESITNEDLLTLMPSGWVPVDDSALLTKATKIIFQDLCNPEYQYIAKIGDEFTVTENFLYTTQSQFRLESTKYNASACSEEKRKKNIIRRKLFQHVLSKFRPRYNSLRAKLELREVARNHKKKFKIYELEVEEDPQEAEAEPQVE